MNYLTDLIQLIIYFAILIPLSVWLGTLYAKIFQEEKNFLTNLLSRPEKFIYKMIGINPFQNMEWKEYARSLISFNVFGFIFLLIILIIQKYLPLNPQKFNNVEFILALNTTISFVTNTNWQSYSGETTLGYFVQMFGLTVQNFISAAAGISVLIALVRAITTRSGNSIGNFYVDLTRSVLYILLPLSIIFSILLMGEGVVQTFSSHITASTLEGNKQVIPLGPAASQISIKQLGTNGGGFFGTNSAFPFENPTPYSNFIQMIAILLIPSSLVFTYGKMLGNKKHAWIIYGAMLFILISGTVVSYCSEVSSASVLKTDQLMEGKETRFGVFNSVLWSALTTSASNGSVNSMHSSLSPVSGLITLFNIQLGEIIFGGAGSGMYGMFLFILLTVFISGLMVGRTPEYFGKKIESYEIKWAIFSILLVNFVILVFTALAVSILPGLSGILNKGPHGLSEILYAFTSGAGNNGSAFAGLNTNTVFYNLTIGIAMLIGRFGVMLPVLAIAGSLVKKNIAPESAGTLSTDNSLFGLLLFSVIIIVGALTFFPVLSIGPFLEHLLMNMKITF